MTNIAYRIWCCIFAAIGSMSATAHTVCLDDVNYSVNTEDLAASVISLADKSKYQVIIPDSIPVDGNYIPVKAIGQHAFSDCKLSIVTLPETINSIAQEAFYDCPNLAAVKIPDSVTILRNRTFVRCLSLISIDTGDGVRELERLFYDGCFPSYIKVGKSVEKIHNLAFSFFHWLDMDCNQVPDLDNDTFNGRINDDVKIFIPQSLEDEYARNDWTEIFMDHLTTEECPLPAEVSLTLPDTIYCGSTVKAECSTDRPDAEYPEMLQYPPYRILSSDHQILTPDNRLQTLSAKWTGKCTVRVVGFGGVMSEEQEIEVKSITEMPPLGINKVMRDVNPSPVYFDLNGRIVELPSKGIFIVNGEKILLSE